MRFPYNAGGMSGTKNTVCYFYFLVLPDSLYKFLSVLQIQKTVQN